MHAYQSYALDGLGLGTLDPKVGQIAGIAASGAALTGTMLAALTTMTAAGPIGAIVAGLIGIGVAIASAFQGCGDTCIEATKIANQIEPILNNNVTTYLQSPIHYASMQAAALNNFDTAWAALTQACSNPQLQSAGQNCIQDRQRGSCAYKTSPGGWSNGQYIIPGANGSGNACWNWFVGYRDPIANDPTVVPDPSTTSAASSLISNLIPSVSTGSFPLLPLLALVGGGLLLMSFNSKGNN